MDTSPTRYLAILAALFKLANTGGSVWTTWAAAISCGFCAGISDVVPAHELGHYVRGPVGGWQI